MKIFWILHIIRKIKFKLHRDITSHLLCWQKLTVRWLCFFSHFQIWANFRSRNRWLKGRHLKQYSAMLPEECVGHISPWVNFNSVCSFVYQSQISLVHLYFNSSNGGEFCSSLIYSMTPHSIFLPLALPQCHESLLSPNVLSPGDSILNALGVPFNSGKSLLSAITWSNSFKDFYSSSS